MDFRKKLKIRLYTAIAMAIIGISIIIFFCIFPTKNDFVSALGLALTVCAAARIKRYFVITKNDQRINKQQIAESDERNIAISQKAKGVAFNIYIIIACLAVIVLELMGISEYTSLITLSVCVIISVYWISYFIINKIS
jgi:uncharacterized membrane protein